MKHTFHKKLAVAILGAIMIALPTIIFAVDDGLGTNVVRNIRIQTTGVIDMGGTAITNWNQVGSTADVANLQIATNLLNTATNTLNTRVNTDLAVATNNLYDATNTLNTRVNTDLAVATNNLYTATNALNVRVNVDLVYATNVLNDATNALNRRVNTDLAVATNNLYAATNALNAAVGGLNANTTRWDNAVVMREGGGSISFSNLYYYASDKIWYIANATNSSTASGLLGLAIGGSIANNGLLLNGQCTNAWGFAAGSIIYMGTNNGALATSMPTGTNNIVRIVGYAINETNIYFNPDRTYIQVLGQ